jgi:hypothetical protein
MRLTRGPGGALLSGTVREGAMGEGGSRRGAEGDADDKAAPLLALLAQQHSAMHQLWAVYVAATFAAAGFGASDERDAIVAVVVTAGFWMFTLGHRADHDRSHPARP